jgi:hypothetical protein
MENSSLKTAVDIGLSAAAADALNARRLEETIGHIRSILACLGRPFDSFANDFQGAVRFSVTDSLRGVFFSREKSEMFVELMFRACRLAAPMDGDIKDETYADLTNSEIASIRNTAETLAEIAKLHEKQSAAEEWYYRKNAFAAAVSKCEQVLRDAELITTQYGSQADCDDRFYQTLLARPDQWNMLGQLAALHTNECAVARMMPRVVEELEKRLGIARTDLETFLKDNPEPS